MHDAQMSINYALLIIIDYFLQLKLHLKRERDEIKNGSVLKRKINDGVPVKLYPGKYYREGGKIFLDIFYPRYNYPRLSLPPVRLS
jgi:hypothetical protein